MKIKGRSQPKADQERGQTTVEFALVVGLLLLLMFAIVDFARLFFAYATMSNGVREGARYGIVHAGPEHEDDIIARAESAIMVIGGEAEVTVEFPDGDKPGGPYCAHLCRVVVRATSGFSTWTPIIPSFEIVAQATMHIE